LRSEVGARKGKKASNTRMTIHVGAGKKRDHPIRKKRTRGTDMRQVTVMVIVVLMVGHHDTQHIKSEEQRASTEQDKTSRQEQNKAHLGGITWWGEYNLTTIPTKTWDQK
jgi:hypothetical protein